MVEQHAPIPSRSWPLLPVLVMLAVAWLAFTWPWLSGHVTVPWDAKAHFYPQFVFLADAFKRRGVAVGEVYSSRYCRCRDTAQLAFGRYEVREVLNGYRGPQPWWEAFSFDELMQVRGWLSDPVSGGGNRILVTHNTHIKALTDTWVDPGEMLVVRPLGRMFFTVVGRIKVADY